MNSSITIESQRVIVASKPLIEMTLVELDEFFKQLDAPDPKELQGNLIGKLYSVEGLRYLPSLIRTTVHRILQTGVMPWKGKAFDQGKGANLALAINDGFQVGFYNVEPGKAYQDKGPVIVLDYDVPENPVLMWRIRGELRRIGEGYYLARMLYVTKNNVFTVLYFTLEHS